MRTIFIWDVHWCFDEFCNLLEKIKYNQNTDKLYLTWDIINKWPKTLELLNFLVNNTQIKSVIWNNEVNFIRYIRNLEELEIDWDWYLNNENYRNLLKKGLFDKKYEKENILFDEYLKSFSKEHIEYLLNLPLYIENTDWLLIHWWVIPWKQLEEQHIDEVTRIRDFQWKPWYLKYTWNKPIIYWHWAQDGISIRNNTIWLDSWCVYWKRLTAYILETNQIIQTPALKTYIAVN